MIITAHGARVSTQSLPNTIEGIRECVREGLSSIEIDIVPISEDDFLVFHNEKLNTLTNGEGYVALMVKNKRGNLWYLNKSKKRTRRVYVLSEIIKLVEEDKNIKELQLDLKTYLSSKLTERLLKNLINMITPIKSRVRITSCADWIIIKLHEMDSTLKLGFDPQFFIDFRKKKNLNYPPYHVNKFGYSDDHPLALYDWETSEDYLRNRALTLCFSALGSDIWYVRYHFLKQSLHDGFNWIEYFHKKGIQVCMWTVDIDKNTSMREINSIIKMNPDRINTNTPYEWLNYLNKK